MAKSADTDDERRRSPITLPTPNLRDDGDLTGVSSHARTRYTQRGDKLALAGVRRAWALGGDVPSTAVGLQADAVRYDPLTDLLLIRKEGCITSVVTPDDWQRAVLRERGWSE